MMNNNYEKYKAYAGKIADVRYAAAVLNWDQETYMPPKGAPARARQLSTLAGLAHELATDREYGDLLESLSAESSLSETEKRNVAESRREYIKNQKYTTKFVQSLSNAISVAFQNWQQARKENNFELFAPSLEQLIRLKKEECQMVGYEDHPYDALLDDYEPGTKTGDIVELFNEVREQLVAFVKEITKAGPVNDEFMYRHYDNDKQWDFGIGLLRQMGYDFEAGRQDISPHPFTVNFSASDVRVTTRIDENNLNEMIWSCIHEGGHALYEQGLNHADYGLPTGTYVSLGIHESQSRLWENNVGRGFPYWKANYPRLQQVFPENLSKVPVQDFYQAINLVKPSLIRTNADELTYHFHIMIRFEIELALIEGKISVKELPEYWNMKYKEYLNIDVPSDAKGVLQDIHWSHGSFGYFPTYSLGSFYAAQFYSRAKIDIPGLEDQIKKGDLMPLLSWLRERIHGHGRRYTAEELCTKVTGEKLNFNYFMDYAREKYSGMYRL